MKPFTVAHVQQTEQTGIAISEHITPILDPTAENGVRYNVLIGVLWDDHRTPSPSYHAPTELMWLDVPGVTDDEESEEEIHDADDDSDEDEEEENDEEEDDVSGGEEDVEYIDPTHLHQTAEIAAKTQ